VAGLYAVVTADNLAAGFASAAFVAFLSSLTQVSFTAVQYAVFSSLMTLLPKTLGGYSGGMVDAMGYPWFFAFTAGLGVPVLVLVVWAGKRLK
jgi:PAT family beta-lactamase induction signal transducer AmpG